MTKQWPRFLNANASYAKAGLWFVKGRKKLVRKPCAFAKKQERRTVNLPRLRWYAYLSPLRFWAILLPSNLLTSNQKKSDPERPGFFGQGSPAKTGGRSVLPFSAYRIAYFILYFPRPALERPISVPFQMRTKFSRCLMRMASVATHRMTSGSQPLRMAV